MKPIDPRIWNKIRNWPEDRIIEWEERAAIIEYDGGSARLVAEKKAYEDIESLFHPDKQVAN